MVTALSILVVDDEPRSRQGVKRILETWSAGKHRILDAANAIEALSIMEKETIDLLISDIRMPEISGLRLLDLINDSGHPIPVAILISGYAEFEYAQQAIRKGVVSYLLKPIGKEKLIEAVEHALEIGKNRNRFERMEKMVDSKLLDMQDKHLQVSEPVSKAISYVQDNLSEPFSLREVAEYIHLNPSYLSALFKEQMDVTFSEYVTRARLQKAKELLLQTPLPIVEIAERIGYRTVKYFITLFKEYVGTSPGQYRSQYQKDGDAS